jgi:hypothetical protein
MSRIKGMSLADFQNALGQANARLLAEAAGRPELHGMGTTLTLAYNNGCRRRAPQTACRLGCTSSVTASFTA